MKRSVGLLLIIAVLWAVSVVWAKAPIPPPPTSSIYVQDYAKVLSAETKQKLNRVGSEVAEKTKAQIVVVTVQELDDTPIDVYGLELLRQWGIGDKTLNNGVLLLIDIKGRQSRIETGYGLEGALPDGKTGQIQDEYMIPYVKDGDYNRGIENTYLALAQVVMAEYQVNGDDVAKPVAANEGGLFDTIVQIIAVVVIIALVILDFMFFGGRITMLVLSLLSKRGGGGGGFGGGSGGGGGSSRRW